MNLDRFAEIVVYWACDRVAESMVPLIAVPLIVLGIPYIFISLCTFFDLADKPKFTVPDAIAFAILWPLVFGREVLRSARRLIREDDE